MTQILRFSASEAIRTGPAEHRGGVRGWAWLSEFTGTAILLFTEVLVLRVLFVPDSAVSRAVPGLAGRLALVGLATGIVLAVLIVSPLGLSSGGHFNPAVTITMWLLRGELAAGDVAGYVAAQALGSVGGVLLGRGVLGGVVVTPAVDYAVIRPHGWPGGAVFLGEVVSIVALMLPVILFLSRPALARWTPLAVGVAVAGLITAGGVTSGGCFNPARQFGPALLARHWAYLWIYLSAPVAGGVGLAVLLRSIDRLHPGTCSLCGIPPKHLPPPTDRR